MVRSQSRTGSHPRKVEARMDEDFDRFGTPEENIHAAAKWARKYRKKHTYHTHVPTRKEIATLPIEELRPLLVGWMEHSPTETIPSRMQIALVRDVLTTRPDAAELKALMSM